MKGQYRIELYNASIHYFLTVERNITILQGNSFIRTKEFAKAIDGSNNYFVIISRESLFELPYSIRKIYGLKESSASKYKKAERVYNEMYQLYTAFPSKMISADKLITEDSESGFQFFQSAYPDMVTSASGKGNVR